MRNFNEIFRENITYDSIKSKANPELYPLSREYIFEKTIRGREG